MNKSSIKLSKHNNQAAAYDKHYQAAAYDKHNQDAAYDKHSFSFNRLTWSSYLTINNTLT